MNVISIAERTRNDWANVRKPAQVEVDDLSLAVPALDPLRVELGYGLLPMLAAPAGESIGDHYRRLRRDLAGEMGVVAPRLRLADDMKLSANAYVIRIKEIVAARGMLSPGDILLVDPNGEPIALPGKRVHEPVFDLPAVWAESYLLAEARARGYRAAGCAAVLTAHISEVLKDHFADLLNYADVKKLLGDLPVGYRGLAAELTPARISLCGIRRVLANLLAERISVRDLPAILEGIAEGLDETAAPERLTVFARARLWRQIENPPGAQLP